MRRTISKHVIGRQTSLCLAGAAVALLAIPSLGSAQEASAKDEVFTQSAAIMLPAGSNALVSFDISWVDAVLKKYYLGDRSNQSVDVIDTNTKVPKLIQANVATATPNTFVGARGKITTMSHSPAMAPCAAPRRAALV